MLWGCLPLPFSCVKIYDSYIVLNKRDISVFVKLHSPTNFLPKLTCVLLLLFLIMMVMMVVVFELKGIINLIPKFMTLLKICDSS